MVLYFIISVLCYLVYFNARFKKSMHMYQQNRYHYDTYFNWIKENYKKVFIQIDILFLFLPLLIFVNSYILISLFIINVILCYIVFKNGDKFEQVKKPLVVTSRVKRMFITTYLLLTVFVIGGLLSFKGISFNVCYAFLGLFLYFVYLVPALVNFINIPIEKIVFNYYKMKAVNKLSSMKSTKVIGITGSYGKTSSKNILNDILNVRFNSFPTPKNFNTPNGLMLTINNHLDKFNDYFIAEMGACRVGEIKELCDLVKPKYGIITTIGSAHLETFGTQENIQKTKFELIESLPSDGVAILNGDDELQRSYVMKNKVKVLWVGIDNKDVDVYASNISLTHKGTKFDCVFKGDENKYTFETKLLGKANIYNILAGILLGKELGISIEDLVRGVRKVNAVEHRLELKQMGSVTIIDDAYNSNPVGSKMAIDVLSMMPGKRIIVTPGMIELGSEQYKYNKEFGKYMKDKLDEVILIGKEQTKPIYDGLCESEFDIDKIYILNDVKDAFPLINKIKDGNTFVLLENDLPDLFNERS